MVLSTYKVPSLGLGYFSLSSIGYAVLQYTFPNKWGNVKGVESYSNGEQSTKIIPTLHPFKAQVYHLYLHQINCQYQSVLNHQLLVNLPKTVSLSILDLSPSLLKVTISFLCKVWLKLTNSRHIQHFLNRKIMFH